jgi:hypothetical protein
MPIEASAETAVLTREADSVTVALTELRDWPAAGWSYRVTATPERRGQARSLLAKTAMGLVSALQAADVAHSLLVCQAGMRVIVIPRKKQAATGDGTLNVAVMEVCGRGIVNFVEGWEPVTAASLHKQLEQVRLTGDPAAAAREAAVAAVTLVATA